MYELQEVTHYSITMTVMGGSHENWGSGLKIFMAMYFVINFLQETSQYL